MKCRGCGGSPEVQAFDSEIALHFPGFDGLNKPIVWAFPKVLICLECGFAEFLVPDDSMQTLRNPTRSPRTHTHLTG